jgi:hypothetical protein
LISWESNIQHGDVGSSCKCSLAEGVLTDLGGDAATTH